MARLSLPDAPETFSLEVAIPELRDWKSWMLREEVDRDVERLREVASYAVPKLRHGSPLLTKLALELWRRGLVQGVKRKGGVGFELFAVSKGAEEQRLTCDLRRPNRMFRCPPRVRIGSPRAFAALDLSDSALEGDDVCAVWGDVQCFFYRLRTPRDMAEWLWLEGLDFAAFVAAAVAEGADAALFEGCDGLGCTVLPMGFAWAPLLAELALEHNLHAAGCEAGGRVGRHRDN